MGGEGGVSNGKVSGFHAAVFAFSRLAASFIPVRRGAIYCARRRVSEANRRAEAALRPENPPVGVRAAANRADMESAPTAVCGIAGFAFSRLTTGLAPVRRGGIYPARGCSRRREVPGTMQASSPTEVCNIAGFASSRLTAMFPRSVGRAFTPAAPPNLQRKRCFVLF